MRSIVPREQLTPCGYMDILGCNGYNTKDVVCVTANGDNNFIDEGIVEGSLLFIDTSEKYQPGQLNVFKFKEEVTPQLKLSRKRISGTTYFGKVLMSVNQYK